MNQKEQTIARFKELIAILETDVVVVHANMSMGLGEPIVMGVDGTTYSHVYKVEIEMHKALK